MSDMVIRDAHDRDAPGLVPLLAALGYPTNEDTLRERMLLLAQRDPTSRVLVAATADGLVGFAVLHATHVLHRPTPVGRVTGIAVLESARRTGAGSRLIEAAEAHFAAMGWLRLEITSGPHHAEAHDFYRRRGYHDNGVRFSKDLIATDNIES